MQMHVKHNFENHFGEHIFEVKISVSIELDWDRDSTSLPYNSLRLS